MNDNMIKYGVIHCHTGNSLYDGAMSPTTLCETAAQLGAPAVTLTDHGIMTGTFEFVSAAKDCGIKAVPGVEAYVQEDDKSSRRMHLLLLPKSYKGYLAVCRAVTESYKRIEDGFPRMNRDILVKCFGKGSDAHGEVIATSACAGGVLASILLRNADVQKAVDRLLNKQSRSQSPNDAAYLENVKLLEEKGREIAALVERREVLNPLVTKSFTARERAVDKMDHDSAEYAEAKAALDVDKLQKEAYASELSALRITIAAQKKKETMIRRQVKDAEESHEKWKFYQDQIDALKATMCDENDLFDEAVSAAKWYVSVFGEGNFYIELQYHGLDMESYSMPKLAKIAKMLNIPVVSANDAHMATKSDDDILRRQLIRSLRFNTWEELTPDMPEYYIKTDKELSSALSKILDKDIVDEAMLGVKNIFDACNVEFPKGLHFPKFRDSNGNLVDAKERLRQMCLAGIERRFPNKSGWTIEYDKRLDYELNIICGMGYADYLCIVDDYVNEGRRLGKNNPEQVGMGVGVGRGSAAGSLVCYLIGITGVDPIKYGLLFERFLNPERVSMPDIDEDFMVEIRDNVIDYIKSIYGEDAVCNIVTKGSFAGKGAIRAAARLLGSKYDNKEEYLVLGNRLARMIPTKPAAVIADADFSEEKEEDAIEVINCAKLLEGASSSYGMHACGVIIADNGNVGDYVSMMKQGPDDPWMCQCTMVEAEKNAGLLKMDFLGLRNLSIITDTLRLIKKNHGIDLDMEKLGASLENGRKTPYDVTGNVFDDIFAKGKTNGVFQFESNGMKKMLRQFGPSNIDDVILLVAAYRPGPMQYLDGITDVKKGRKRPTYIAPNLAPILDKTYGYPIYQEQIMQIFHDVAGFSMGQADEVRRAMGKKHIEILLDPKTNFKGRFIDGLKAAGASESDAEDFWMQLLDFASYAFNKSHAAAYAFTAFYTAWLKLNYPLEYMKALLNYTALDKIPMVINECISMGIEVLPPDINKSGEGFDVVDGKILFGLSSVKGIASGAKAIIEERKKNGAFRDIKDFISRSPLSKDAVEAMIGAGAMDSWGPNRAAMINAYGFMLDTYKKIVKKREDVANVKEELLTALQASDSSITTLPINSDELYKFAEAKVIKKGRVTQYFNHISRLKALEQSFHDACIPTDEIIERKTERLEREKELIGMYVSGHPLDEYEDVAKIRTYPICDAEPTSKKVTLCGRIEDVKYAARKSDGKSMAFFSLTDETGSIHVCCFTQAYDEFGEYVNVGNFVSITGRIESEGSENDNNNDNDEQESLPVIEKENLKLFVARIAPLKKKKETVMLSLPTVVDWQESLPVIEKYKGNDLNLLFHDLCSGEIRKCTFCVSERILNTPEIKVRKVDNIRV